MEHRLIVEVDGVIHREMQERDHMRDDHLSLGGFTVIRFTNEQVLKTLSEVLTCIAKTCRKQCPHPQPFSAPQRGEGSSVFLET